MVHDQHNKKRMVFILELNQRLELLLESGQISSVTKKSMMGIIEMFQNKLGIRLTEENGAMFITHLSIACERLNKDEKIEPIEESIYCEVRNNHNYNKSEAVFQEIEKELDVKFSECEKMFIILHLCGIL